MNSWPSILYVMRVFCVRENCEGLAALQEIDQLINETFSGDFRSPDSPRQAPS